MDNVIHSIKSFFIGNSTPRDNRAAVGPNAQPRLYEAHEHGAAVTAQPATTPTNSPGSPAQPAVTLPTFIAQRNVGTDGHRMPKVQPVHDRQSFCAAARKGDLALVLRHLEAGLGAEGALCEAAKHGHLEIVQLLLPNVDKHAKHLALMGLIDKASDFTDRETAVAIGAMLLGQLEDYSLYFLRASGSEEACGEEMAVQTPALSFRKEIEVRALREMIGSENMRGMNSYLNHVATSRDKAVVFVELARSDLFGIAKPLLRESSERAKINALAALALAAADAYPIDCFVAAGREIVQTLQDRETSLAKVRSLTAPEDPLESSIVPYFLSEIFRT